MIPAKKIAAITKRILKQQGIARATLSLVFVTDHKIKKLNKRYLGHDFATDVLAFDLNASQGMPIKEASLNAEIVISTTTVCRNAKRFTTTPFKELILCIIHGILHLSGYDDHGPQDVIKMREREGQIMGKVLTS